MDPNYIKFNEAVNSISYINNVYDNTVSKSTSKRRERLLHKNNSENSIEHNWRKQSLATEDNVKYNDNTLSDIKRKSHQGHYGFNDKNPSAKNNIFKKTSGKTSSIKSISHANKRLYPNTTMNIIPVIMTPSGIQTFIDEINQKDIHYACDDKSCCDNGIKNHIDPHYCCKDKVCNMEVLRQTCNNKPDFRWGLHVCAIDYDFVINTQKKAIGTDDYIMIPSWHKKDINTWYENYKSMNETDKKGKVPYPIYDFDLSILRDSNVSGYFRELKNKHECELNLGKRLYILVNLFGKDPPDAKNDYKYTETVQLIRGRVESIDYKHAGITKPTIKNPDKDLLEFTAKIGACRETEEECDNMIVIDYNNPDMICIADLEQTSIKNTVRIMVFAYNKPTNIRKIIPIKLKL
jgi:hypothetical protein